MTNGTLLGLVACAVVGVLGLIYFFTTKFPVTNPWSKKDDKHD